MDWEVGNATALTALSEGELWRKRENGTTNGNLRETKWSRSGHNAGQGGCTQLDDQL